MVAAMEHDSKIFPVKKFIRMSEDMAADIFKTRHGLGIASESETMRRALTLGLTDLRSADAVEHQAEPPAPDDDDEPGYFLPEALADRVEAVSLAYGGLSRDVILDKLLELGLAGAERALAKKKSD